MSYLFGVLSILEMNQYHYFFKTFAIPFAENTPLTELTYHSLPLRRLQCMNYVKLWFYLF